MMINKTLFKQNGAREMIRVGQLVLDKIPA